MLQELRTGNLSLISYLIREPIVSELCSWSMTLTHQSSPDFDRISRIATETLTCGTALATQLLSSTALKQFLSDFSSSSAEWDPLCAGHFQRLLTHLLRSSEGAFLANLPNFVPNAVKHLRLLAVAELLIVLAQDYGQPIAGLIVDFIANEEPPVTAALYALRQILGNGGADAELIGKIEAVAKAAKDKVTGIELYRLLKRLNAAVGDIGEFESPTVAGFARAAKGGDLKEGIELILKGNVHGALGNQILAQVKAAPKDVLEKVAEEVEFGKKLKEEVTAQQLEIVNVLVQQSLGIAVQLPPEVVSRAGKLHAPYGGELPIGRTISRMNAD
jgi:hypothetical protein